MSVRLSLFGTIHANRLRLVSSELAAAADGADAICVEWGRPADERALLAAAVRFPAVVLGYAAYSLLIALPLYALFNRRPRSTEYLAARRVANGRPVHEVDRSPLALLAERERWWAWAAGSWLAILVPATVWPVATAETVAAMLGGTLLVRISDRRFRKPGLAAAAGLAAGVATWWLVATGIGRATVVLVGYLALVVALGATVDERDAVMVDQVASLAAEHGYESVCLATGYFHLGGIVAAADDADVTVEELFRCRWLTDGIAVPRRDGSRQQAVHVSPDVEADGGILARRAAATLFDWGILAAGFAAAVAVGNVLPSWFWVLVAVWAGLALLYHLLLEIRFGRSLGKRAMGLVVVRTDGSPVDGRGALLRWLLRPVDFLPVAFLLGAGFAAATTGGQRLGDLVAGTTVVPSGTPPE